MTGNKRTQKQEHGTSISGAVSGQVTNSVTEGRDALTVALRIRSYCQGMEIGRQQCTGMMTPATDPSSRISREA